MEIAKNFFEVLPLWTAYVAAYLLRSEPRQAQALDLVLRNIVIEDNHAQFSSLAGPRGRSLVG